MRRLGVAAAVNLLTTQNGDNPQVIVVGAGPAGMMLALLLSRSGVSVMVLEQATTFAREFRGELLQPGSTRILNDLGLRERILSLSSGFPAGLDIQYDRKTVRFDFPRPDELSKGGGVAIIPQQQFLEALATEASRQAGFNIMMGCSVRDLLFDADRVVGVRAQLHNGESLALRAPLVVACDGRFSAVRRAAGIEMRAKSIPFDLLWFSTPIPAGLSNRVYVRITRNQLFGSFASRNNRMQVGWLIHKGEYARLRTQPFGETVDRIVSHVPLELSDSVRRDLRGWNDLSLLPVVSQMAERWSQPGMLLLGDAAHPMSPAGGQGINVAIYDAVVAAARLVPAIKDGTSLEDVARSFERERRPSIIATQRLQNRFTSALCTLGPSAAVKFATLFIRAGARVSWHPRFVTKALDRLLWGNPQVRADRGPWQRIAP
jgi:2-polyprenyl-6-methoxyphenol hydroxylase-like FAD-dependent oxidoreductase